MNIYFDENMPFAKDFFSAIGTLIPFSGRDLTAEQLIDADVLLVRSITSVNETLLTKSPKLKFVGTATIGVDHIDADYLAQRNIPFYSAPGCNAISVAEYVLSSLVVMAERYLLNLSALTLGIVGAGNTGTRLSEKLTALNIKHVLCDPLLEQQALEQQEREQKELAHKEHDKRHFVSLDEALACDVISLHVPLTFEGEHPTYHLLNEVRLKRLTDQQILINACRGEIVDNQALLAMKQQGHQVKLILDVWENEPNILSDLIAYTDIATAHIAGYSLEGKARGTEMLYQALCQQLNISINCSLEQFLPSAAINYLEIKPQFDEVILNQLVKMVYDVRRDDAIFRQQLACQGFDQLRKTYPTRREFSATRVALLNQASNDVPHQLGFSHP